MLPRPRQIRLAIVSLIVSFVALSGSAFPQGKRLAKASLHGTVRDSRGQPVAGATIRLEPRSRGAQPPSTASDAFGQFSLTDLDVTEYENVSAEATGFKPTRIPCSLAPDRTNEITITLVPEAAPSPAKKQTAQFYDEPKFTVSGVTDTTALGGHGSDTVVRTRDSLAKETSSLTAETKPASPLTREALQAEHDHAQALVAKDPGKAEPHHMLADADERLGDSVAAVHEYQRATELDPSETYVFDWGSELLLHHAPEPALEVFTNGNRLFPKSERMLLGLGAAWFALGSLDAAIEQFRAASDLAPNDATPYLFVGKMEKAEKVPSPTAMEMLHHFVSHSPENAQANYYYASTLWRSREGSHAATLAADIEKLLHKAIAIDPNLVAARVELGIIHADLHQYDKAITEYQQAIQIGSSLEKIAPGSQLEVLQESHFRLATAYRETGDREQSAIHLKALEQLSKESQQLADRERHDIRQFVYTLRDQPAGK